MGPPDCRLIVSIPAPVGTNAYQRLLYEQLEANGIRLLPEVQFSLDWLVRHRRSLPILHFHWPEYAYRDGWPQQLRRGAFNDWAAVVRFGLRLAAARMLGYRVVWTVHEIVPHDSRGRCDWAASALLAIASRWLIAHDQPTAEACRRLPRAKPKVVVIPHASYVGVYERERTAADVRDALGLNWARFVFLSFGRIRRYKSMPLLMEAFRRTAAELPDVALVVAGAPADEDEVQRIEAAAWRDYRVRTVLRFFSDYEVADLFAAADAYVYPRGGGGTSGAILLALSFGTPVVAARLPAYEELIGEDSAGWLFEADDPHSLQAALIRAADPGIASVRGMRASQRLAGRGWPEIGRRTAELLLAD